MITKKEYLRLKLVNYFNLSELRTICFDLGIDYDTLSHQNRGELAIGLLDLLINDDNASDRFNKRVESLIRLMSRQRPHISWSDMPNE